MKPELIAGYGPGLSEAEEAMRDDGPKEDPITGLTLNPDGSLRVIVLRGKGKLTVKLQRIYNWRVIATATGNDVRETLGRIIQPHELHDVREVECDSLRGE